MNPDFLRKIKRDGITKDDLKTISDPVFINIAKLALKFSDGVIIGSRKLNAEIKGLVKDSKDSPRAVKNNTTPFVDLHKVLLTK